MFPLLMSLLTLSRVCIVVILRMEKTLLLTQKVYIYINYYNVLSTYMFWMQPFWLLFFIKTIEVIFLCVVSDNKSLDKPLSNRNIWVSGLSNSTKATDLKTMFSKYGKVRV